MYHFEKLPCQKQNYINCDILQNILQSHFRCKTIQKVFVCVTVFSVNYNFILVLPEQKHLLLRFFSQVIVLNNF